MSSLNLAKNVLMISLITSRDHPGEIILWLLFGQIFRFRYDLKTISCTQVQQQDVQNCLRENLGKKMF